MTIAERIRRELVELGETGDQDSKDALKSWDAGELEAAFYSVDAAAEGFATIEDTAHVEAAEWVKEEIDALL